MLARKGGGTDAETYSAAPNEQGIGELDEGGRYSAVRMAVTGLEAVLGAWGMLVGKGRSLGKKATKENGEDGQTFGSG